MENKKAILNSYGRLDLMDLQVFVNQKKGEPWSYDSSLLKRVDTQTLNMLAISNLGNNLISKPIFRNELLNDASGACLLETEKMQLILTSGFEIRNIEPDARFNSGTYAGSFEDLSATILEDCCGGIILTSDKWDVCPNSVNAGKNYLYVLAREELGLLTRFGQKKFLELHREDVYSRAKKFNSIIL